MILTGASVTLRSTTFFQVPSMTSVVAAAPRTGTGGGWHLERAMPQRRLGSLTVGIVGFGRIGRIAARKASPAAGPIATRTIPARARAITAREASTHFVRRTETWNFGKKTYYPTTIAQQEDDSERNVPGNPRGYPLCDVAQYWTIYDLPGKPGTTWIYAHAQEGMFLPLFTISEATFRMVCAR